MMSRGEGSHAGWSDTTVATVPEDLQRELDARPAAAAFFAGLSSTNRYAIRHRLQTATLYT